MWLGKGVAVRLKYPDFGPRAASRSGATRHSTPPPQMSVGPLGFRRFPVGPDRQSDVADASELAHIRPRFGLHTRVAGQPDV